MISNTFTPQWDLKSFLSEVTEAFQKVLSFVKKGVDLIEKPVILEE